MTIYEIIATIISGLAVFVALYSLRNKKMEKENEVVRDVAILKQNNDSSKLTDRMGALERTVAVLEERVSNQIHMLEQLDEKLDEIAHNIKE